MTSQTSYIAAFIFLGFLVFITMRGELPQYKAAIFGGSNSASTSAPSLPASAILGPLASLPSLLP